MSSLPASRTCVACHGGMPALTPDEVAGLLSQLEGWRVEENKKLIRSYKFRDFVEAVQFVDLITPVIEEQGHHPVLTVRWGAVRVSLWTHAIDALTDNVFIMAARFDKLYRELQQRRVGSRSGAPAKA